MSLLLMPAQSSPSKGHLRLVPSITGLFRKSSTSGKPDQQQPGDDPGLLSPHDNTRSRSNSTSRSVNSITSNGLIRAKSWIQHVSGRSSASSMVATPESARRPLTENDFKEAEDLFCALEKYNDLITNEVSVDDSFAAKRLGGIQKILRKYHDCGVISELPESLFDVALLWCPAGEMTRKPADCKEPSWSWKGWNGAVNFPFDPLTCPDIRSAGAPDVFMVTLVKSFNIGPASGTETYTLRNRPEKSYQRRIEYPDGRWIPLGSKTPTIESNILRFKAEKIPATGFQFEQLYFYEGKEEPLICTGLRNSQNLKCGAIMEYEKNIRAAQGELHFVLLSASLRVKSRPRNFSKNTSHPSGIPIWRNGEFLNSDEIGDADESYESGDMKMYNVMLVEDFGFEEQVLPNGEIRQHPISRRVAVGRIHEAAWNASNHVLDDIVLH